MTTAIASFAKNLLRDRLTWWLLVAHAVVLLWWRFAVPWPSAHHTMHTQSTVRVWAYQDFWTALPVLILLAFRFHGPREGAWHPLSLTSGPSDSSKPFWLALRISTEAAVLFLMTAFVQSSLELGLGAPFHVEQMLPFRGLAWAAAGVSACLLVHRYFGAFPQRSIIFAFLCALPALWDQSFRPEASSCWSFTLAYLGLVLMPQASGRRKNALRHLG